MTGRARGNGSDATVVATRPRHRGRLAGLPAGWVGRVLLAGLGVTLNLIIAVAIAGDRGAFDAVVNTLPGFGFVAAGLAAWAARPQSRTGPLIVVAGALWGLGQGVDAREPLPYTVGMLLASSPFPLIALAVIGFPGGRLRAPRERVAVASAAVYALVLTPLWALFTPPRETGCESCPADLNRVLIDDGFGDLADVTHSLLTVPLAVWVLALLARRWRRASRPAQRILAPVVATGTAALAALLLLDALEAIYGSNAGGDLAGTEATLYDAAAILLATALSAMAVGFLAGLLRTRVTRSTMGELVAGLSGLPETGPLRELIARALGDETLELGFWVPQLERYVDANARPIDLPAPADPGRTATTVARGGEQVAVLIHDPALLEDQGLLDAVSAAARLALENERLRAEVKAQLQAVRESRRRIVEAGDRERQRIERDLHDGAQQRLVSLMLALRMAGQRLASLGEEGAAELTERAAAEAKSALEELRELAHGLHPQILSQEGLRAALESLAERAAVPVEIRCAPDERLPEPVEACTYFVCSEALQNASKHARATQARISALRRNGLLAVTVEDDGVGGADPGRGSGLRGLQDRVEAAGGKLSVSSPPGEGTLVAATVPVAASPEQVIRRYLDEHGDQEDILVEHLVVTWRLNDLTDEARSRIGRALAGAGVRVDPPLSEVAKDASVRLSIEPERRDG